MRKCLLCGNPLNVSLGLDFLLSFKAYRPPIICQRCRRQFQLISKDHCCKDCSRAGDFKDQTCSDCQRWRHVMGREFRNHSLYQYNSMMSEYMHQYKFQGDYRLRKVFQEELTQFVKKFERTIVPIPIHQSTYERRGFNQVVGLLNRVKITPALTTIDARKSVPQSRKTRSDRLKLAQPFRIVDKFKGLIRGNDVAVVDDVYTTGTTIRHAARLLRTFGANSVIGVTLSR